MKMLEKDGVIRVRDAKVTKSVETPQVQTEVIRQPENTGKLDFVETEKVAKVQKKKK